MQAIEFNAQQENGSIKIPKQYLKTLGKNFRVIILTEEQKPKQRKKMSRLNIKTKDLKFDRDEAHER